MSEKPNPYEFLMSASLIVGTIITFVLVRMLLRGNFFADIIGFFLYGSSLSLSLIIWLGGFRSVGLIFGGGCIHIIGLIFGGIFRIVNIIYSVIIGKGFPTSDAKTNQRKDKATPSKPRALILVPIFTFGFAGLLLVAIANLASVETNRLMLFPGFAFFGAVVGFFHHLFAQLGVFDVWLEN